MSAPGSDLSFASGVTVQYRLYIPARMSPNATLSKVDDVLVSAQRCHLICSNHVVLGSALSYWG